MLGAEAVVRCLEAEGVDTVFGYPGVAIVPVFNSLMDSSIHEVLVRSEQNAAHMASGLARISGKVGVAIVTSGPGAANLLTGIATAYADSIPLVCISGQVNSELLGRDVFQELDVTGAAESIVKFSYLVRNVNDIPRIFKEAFYIANSGRRGPVLIDIPADIQTQEIKKFVYPETVSLRTYKPTFKGNTMQLKKLMKALEGARRPLICVGGGVQLAHASGKVRQFVERYNIPVVCTMMGIGVMPTEHPLFLGMIGNNGEYAANKAVTEADLLIMVGARLSDRAVNRPEVVTTNKQMVHIDVDPAEIGKNASSTIPIVGDAGAIFGELLGMEASAAIAEHFDEWLGIVKEYKKRKITRPKLEGTFVDPAVFVRKLSMAMEPDAVYVADVGENQIWSCNFAVIRDGRFLTSGGMGTMGYAIPAGIGAKMADPTKQVVATCGDGSFQMAMCELATLRQQNVDLKIIIFNNGYLGMVREFQHYHCQNRYAMVDIAGYPHVDKLAEAYDLSYVKVDNMEDIDRVIDEFLQTPGSAIMECFVDPEDVAKVERSSRK